VHYRPPQSRSGLTSPLLMSGAIIFVTLLAAYVAGPRNQTGVIVTGVLVLLAYLGFVFWVRRRNRDDDL
jgi:hypothetical protein